MWFVLAIHLVCVTVYHQNREWRKKPNQCNIILFIPCTMHFSTQMQFPIWRVNFSIVFCVSFIFRAHLWFFFSPPFFYPHVHFLFRDFLFNCIATNTKLRHSYSSQSKGLYISSHNAVDCQLTLHINNKIRNSLFLLLQRVIRLAACLICYTFQATNHHRRHSWALTSFECARIPLKMKVNIFIFKTIHYFVIKIK